MGCCCGKSYDSDSEATDIEFGELTPNKKTNALDPEFVALLIGIKYEGTKYELNGCVNDLKNTYNIATDNLGMSFSKIYVGIEDEKDFRPKGDVEYFYPDKKNLEKYLTKVVKNAKKGTVIYFHFSGHGAQLPDSSGEEEDGKDEGVVSSDLKLLQDDFLIQMVTKETKMISIMDCCHSGTIWDIEHESPGMIVSFSACQDSQVAQEVKMAGSETIGKFSRAIRRTFKKKSVEEIRKMKFKNLQKAFQKDMGKKLQKCVTSISDPSISSFNDIILSK